MTAGVGDEVWSRMAALAEQLAEAGVLDPPWRAAYEQVPRHLFIPNVVWHSEGAYFRAFSRDEHPEWWWDQVYADEFLVTQVDDGATAPGQLGRAPTCSASMPSLVLWMLRELDVRDGQRVLEVGTGTGYSSALLSARLGGGLVTTVEVDPALAERARDALAGAAQHPTVITGDGAEGYAPYAPYDRVIATCSVQRVPHAWVGQARPGAVIVTPWGTPFANNALARLAVRDDRTASGRFVGGLAFMRLRSQRVPHGHVDDFVHHEDQAQRSGTKADLWDMFGEHAEFAVGLRMPRCHHIIAVAGDDSGEFTVWLFDDAGSWASVDYEPGLETYPVHQYGPRRLWDEVEAAYQWWIDAGRPERERFGLTVTPEGQHVWLDEPGRTMSPPS